MENEFVAIIFARGGSKGLPNKNILPFAGKPLISWSIEQAIRSNLFKRIIVSTDSEEIADVARAAGAEIPFMRPLEFAQDNSSEWSAWCHAIEFLFSDNGILPKGIVSLPATAPLRNIDDIKKCIHKFENTHSDIVLTYTEGKRNPYFNMVKINNNGYLEIAVANNKEIPRRQDAPLLYDLTTVAYVLKPNFILNNNFLFSGNVQGVFIPEERAIDIDTELDFKLAEFLMYDKISRNEY